MKRLSYFICSIIIASVVCIQGTAFGERGCVLIASSDSAFKDAVREQVVRELTQQYLSVTAASRIQDVDSVARMLVAKGMKQIKEKE